MCSSTTSIFWVSHLFDSDLSMDLTESCCCDRFIKSGYGYSFWFSPCLGASSGSATISWAFDFAFCASSLATSSTELDGDYLSIW